MRTTLPSVRTAVEPAPPAAVDLAPFVPPLLRAWLAEGEAGAHRAVDGTLAMVDISGFTQLTEGLAARGRVGAEELTEVLNTIFSELLLLGRVEGGNLVTWSGDAVLLLFEGDRHAVRAARAAHRMRDRLDRIGTVRTAGDEIRVRMSVGIHSGEPVFFLVGDPGVHRELLVCGPAATRTVAVEAAARTGEIRLSAEAADLLPPGYTVPDGATHLLTRSPPPDGRSTDRHKTDDVPAGTARGDGAAGRLAGPQLAGALTPPVREFLLTDGPSADHRKIAVAFVRFSGTDDLLARDGPDRLATVLDDCVRLVQRAAQRHGVTFLESDVDADAARIMLVAGAPRCGERNEDRLLRTVQHIVDASPPLPFRIGVDRGAVFTGVLGPTFCRTYSVKGDAVNVAARLAGTAHPGEALVSLATLAHASARFEHEPLPDRSVKGKSAPIRLARLGSAVLPCPESTDAEGEIVGRERELAQLRSAAAEVSSGTGALVEIVGEPGIGKTRLAQALVAELDAPSYLFSCDEYETLTPYWPFRPLFESVLRLRGGGRDHAALRRAVGEYAPRLCPWSPLLAKVVDIDVPSTPEVDAVDPRFRQGKLQEVAADFLATVLPARAVLLFEDVHLMDDASAGLLDRLCAVARTRPWFVVVTRRDVAKGFPTDRATATIRLRPLDDEAALRLAQVVGATDRLPRQVVEAVTRRAEGNPLFLHGLLQASGTATAGDVLPDTVEALITSELDRLPAPERAALRCASVLGMHVDRAALRALLGRQPLPVGDEAMRRMARFVRPDGPDSFRFVHQLVRDTAYETLPFRTRRALHGAAGDLLEARAADPDDIAEVLSLHFAHADRPDKAWHYSRIGGERAADKYAYAQADELFTRALRAARQVPSVAAEDILSTNVALGDARFRVGRHQEALAPYRAARRALGARPVEAALLLRREAEIEYRCGRLSAAVAALTRARRLLSEDDESERAALARVEAFYAITRQGQGRFREALRWARRAEHTARRSGDLAACAEALQAVCCAQAMLGDPSHAGAAREAVDLYERLGDRAGQSRALNNLAMFAWLDGRGVEALDMFRQAQRLATDAGDTVKAVAAEYNVGDVLLRMGRVEEARALFCELVPVLRWMKLEEYAATAGRGLGTALALTGQQEDGAELLRSARARLDELNEPAEVLETDAALAWTALEAGDAQRAARVAGEALERAEALEVVHLLPWLLRLQGAALADLGRHAPASEILRRARHLAQTHCRVELGFVLAELSRVCRALGATDEADEYARAAEGPLSQLGFTGSRRHPCRATSSA